MPKISVIMSIYKEPSEWMEKSIISILSQSFSDFEFIIVNDFPNRIENQELLNKFESRDKRIKIITNDSNIGLTKSLNKALLLTSGKYVARMDCDDISHKDRLEKQYHYMEKHPEIDVCGCNIKAFGDCEKIISYPEDMSKMFLYIESPFAHPTVFIRKDSLNGMIYNEDYRYSQDFELWSRLYWKGAKFYNIQEILLDYRYSSMQIMSTNNHNQLQASKNIRRNNLLKEMKKVGVTYSIGDDISLKDAYGIPKNIKASEAIILKLRYFLYLSVNASFINIVLALVFTGDMFRLKFIDLLHVLYYKIKKVDQSKY